MENKKGGIKTSILLFSLLVVLSFMLFFYAFSILADNRIEIAKKLTNVNECTNVRYDVINPLFQGGNLTMTFKNDMNSINVFKIYVIADNKSYKQDVSIDPGDIKRISLEGIPQKEMISLYVNDCDEYKKSINIKV